MDRVRWVPIWEMEYDLTQHSDVEWEPPVLFDEMEDTDIPPVRQTLTTHRGEYEEEGAEILAMAQVARMIAEIPPPTIRRVIVGYLPDDYTPIWETREVYEDGTYQVRP